MYSDIIIYAIGLDVCVADMVVTIVENFSLQVC